MGESADTIFPGYAILMMGWMGVFVGQFGWFLNLLLWPALVLAASRSSVRQSRKLGLAALMMVLVADALFWRDMYGDDGATPIPVFGTGYYLWFAVMVASGAC